MSYYSDKFVDFFGNKIEVNWTRETWEFHLSKHPELQNFRTASGLIAEAILRPSLVLKRKAPNQDGEITICYYKEHKRHQGDVYYTKVVAGYKHSRHTCFYVKSVWKERCFWENIVREAKYPKIFKEIWREQTTYL